jgi:hypothetical protein
VRREPIFPLLSLLSLAILAVVLLFDGAGLLWGFDFFAVVGFWSAGGGIVAGLLSTGTGLAEMARLPVPSRDRRRAGIQGLLNAGMLGLFAMVWLSRWGRHTLGGGAYLLEVLALAAGVTGAWLTRRLVTGDSQPAEPAAARTIQLPSVR